jgi:FtsZ-interacting cell division protein ZipA
MEVRTIMLIVQIVAALIIVVTAFWNVRITRDFLRRRKHQTIILDAMEKVVEAAIEWDKNFDTKRHVDCIFKLRAAIDEYHNAVEFVNAKLSDKVDIT